VKKAILSLAKNVRQSTNAAQQFLFGARPLALGI
jgi:hypothetical protein